MKDEMKNILSEIQEKGNYNSDEFEEFTIWLDGILLNEDSEVNS
jgi:hypothetical protein